MEDLFDTRWFNKTKLFVSIIGQWPYQARRTKNIIRTSYHLYVASGLPSMLRAFYLYWVNGKLKAVVLCFPIMFTLAGVSIKYNHYTLRHAEMKELFERLRSDWVLISNMDQKSRNVLEKYADIGRATVKFYSTYIYLSLSLFLAAPNVPRILDIFFPLNESRSTRQLYPMDYGEVGNNYQGLIFIHSSIGTLLVINIFVACESIYMPLVFHCCGLFSVVRYADYLNEYYSYNFLVLVTMNMMLVSVTGLQIVLRIGLLEEIIAAVVYLLAQLLHLFFLSLPGQFLMDTSESVRESAYSFPWYNLQPNVQKLLILIIMRSSKPSLITAGSFFALQMETFSSVVQTSMSYLTVLSSFY